MSKIETPLVLSFGDSGADDPGLVGGKAASLTALREIGEVRGPDGFVVTTAGYSLARTRRNPDQRPTSALALQSASARVAAPEERQKQLDRRRNDAMALLQQGAEVTARAELVRIDLDVCRTLLTEVRTRLGRLEPMRCQLLRQ